MERHSDTVGQAEAAAKTMGRNHLRVGAYAASGALAMLLLAFASVPLYRLFCQVTGFAGTTQKASQPSSVVLDRTITIRFDATVNPALDWMVKPVQTTQTIRFGETALAYYRATNNSAKTLVGTASFNVAPDQTGAFFNKLECFCFTEQRLEPGQSIDMPVSYFIDPAMAGDKDAGHIGTITLSYTFFPVEKPKLSAASPVPPGKGS